MMKFLIFSHSPKAYLSIDSNPSLKLTFSKPIHFSNAWAPIETIVLGIITEVRFVHPLNARSPILITVYSPIFVGIA